MPWLAYVSVLLVALGSPTATGMALGRSPGPAGLEAKLAAVAARASGKVGVSVVHVESGRTAAVGGNASLPLYSVFKLPLAVAVLKEVEAGRLRLERKVSVTPEDVSPGAPGNTERWRDAPVEVTVRQLLESSMVDSDNTASDKLLSVVGGPATLTRQIRALGFAGIEVRLSTKEMVNRPDHPNQGSAIALSKLLASLQRGLLLRPAERALLWDVMGRSRTGAHRLRGSLPPGTPVVDRTGTGRHGSATNDVGVVTLPGAAGHLAIAVLIAGSKLPPDEQERVIAEIGRTAFETFTTPPAYLGMKK